MKEFVRVNEVEDGVKIETELYEAVITPEGKYRTGVLGGTFLDKQTGAHDLGFGLNVTDNPCVPASSKDWEQDPELYPPLWCGTRRLYVGVENPQLCCAPDVEIEYEVIQERRFALVHQWFTFTKLDKSPGSKWEEWLIFPCGKRYFFAFNKLISGAKYFKLSLCGDWPGHIKDDNFDKVYLSYHGIIPKSEFLEDFPPDAKFFYHRDFDGIPDRMLRAYQIVLNNQPGPWLAGMTLDPGMMYQAFCNMKTHRKDRYVCMIGFLGGKDVVPGESISNVNLIGFFDSIEEMNQVYDRYRYQSGSVQITDILRFIL